MRKPVLARDKDREVRSMVRSFFEAPKVIYANRALQSDPARLKFDLADAHRPQGAARRRRRANRRTPPAGRWAAVPKAAGRRRHECPGRAARVARLRVQLFRRRAARPKVPFRRFLARERYRVEAGTKKLELTPAVVMRRMTKVSPYPYWHFFDAYPPGFLRAVYRGNGIPLPWGNLAQRQRSLPQLGGVPHADAERGEPGSQISVLRDGERSLLYCCHSMRVRDMAGNPHVLSVGVDLAPALDSNGVPSEPLIDAIFGECLHHHGEARIPKAATQAIGAVANVLNIAWIEEALEQPARIICPRSARCPRPERCEGARPRAPARSPTCARRSSVARRDCIVAYPKNRLMTPQNLRSRCCARPGRARVARAAPMRPRGRPGPAGRAGALTWRTQRLDRSPATAAG